MKTKFIFLILMLANINLLWASNTKIDGIWYDIDKNKRVASVTYRGKDHAAYVGEYKGAIAIPDHIKYRGEWYAVTTIGAYAFYDCTSLTAITIPGTITEIGDGAFRNCSQLSSLIIPNSVITIGASAFNGCSGMTSATIGTSVTSIGQSAFSDCFKLTSITIPVNVKVITPYLFSDCYSLTSVSISNSVTRIGKNAFRNCCSLTSVSIPSSVTSIGKNAFGGCSGLTSVSIPNGVTNIGNAAFYECKKLISVAIPYSVKNIGSYAFFKCESLTSITIPDNVTSIGQSAFTWCDNLRSVNIGKSVQTIGKLAFYGCSNLVYIELPNSVTTIGDNAFGYCENLTTITIPDGVKSLGNYAFSMCTKLRNFYYPSGLNISKAGISASAKVISYNPKENQRNNSPIAVSENPPLLALIDKSQLFFDDNSNNQIDADENCTIRFQVENKGKGSAKNCEARITMFGTLNGISVQTVKLPTIAAGQNYEVQIPISSDIRTRDGSVTFSIEVYEPNGWGVAPFDIKVATKAYEPPYLQVVDYNIASNSGKIRKMEPFTLTFNLQNTKYGDAEDVHVKIKLPNNVFVMDGRAEYFYPVVQSGDVKSVQIVLAANNNYYTNDIPIMIDVKEKHGKFAENKQLSVALNQTTSSSTNVAAKEEETREHKEIQLAMIKSDVDRNIPVTNTKNPNTFVLIIANEHYQQVAAVPFALNDGNVFREYCIKTLGVSEKHIHYVPDATGNQIKAQVNWLANITEAFDNPQIIVYYAGHGIPDEASKTAYLLPVDGNGSDITTGYKLDDLYATLGNMPASQITIFMDACFSGSKREQGMLASARGVALKAKSGVPRGNMVVFSAAQGDETAYPNKEQQHGLFTYYLLKKLQETEGNIGLEELGEYITKNVSQQSLILNEKKQTPCVIPSATVGIDWQNWKLK